MLEYIYTGKLELIITINVLQKGGLLTQPVKIVTILFKELIQ